MKKQFLYLLALTILIGLGCKKEVSFEIGDSPAAGTLQSDVTGDCLPKTVNGTYIASTALVPTTNTITVTVDVTRTGTYVVTTDTVNGYFFRGVGTFTALGAQTVTLRGNGTPFADGVNNFVVSFDGSVCDIQVTVLPEGSGPAVFTLAGAPSTCTTPTINGVYARTVPLSAANTVVLNVNVTTAGTYNVSTTAVNGMTFAGTGTLATGPQTITLTGTGTPTTAGNNTISVTVGSTTCTFVVNVIDPITGTLGGSPGACTPVTVNGSYYNGFPLDATNTIQIQITTTAGGPYSISTNSVNGFSFSGTGSVPGAGTHTITLNGTGTPNATGAANFTVTFGTSSCTFSINVSAGAAFTADCSSAVVSGTYQVGIALSSAVHTVDIDVNVTSTGPYNISTTATNGMVFSASGTFSTLGVQTITLTGSGTPAATGTFNIPMPGTTPCTFPVTVAAAPTIDWKFTVGTTTYQGSSLSADYDNTTLPPFSELAYEGDNAANDYFFLDLIDLTGGILNGETYKADATTFPPENIMFSMYFENATASVTYQSDAGDGTNLKVTITSHNTATKTIIGTFSGTVTDQAGATKTITNGQFTIKYPL